MFKRGIQKVKTGALALAMAVFAVFSMATGASAATTMTFTPPTMPDSTSIFQQMLDNFGQAGTIGIAVIGGAVALGVIIILGMWGWRLAKKWLSAAK